MRAGDLSLGRTGVATEQGVCMRVPWGIRADAGGTEWMVNGTADLPISSPGEVIRNFLTEEDALAAEPGGLVPDYLVRGGREFGVMPRVREKIREALRPLVQAYLAEADEPSREGLERCLNEKENIGKLASGLQAEGGGPCGFALGGGRQIVKVSALQCAPEKR